MPGFCSSDGCGGDTYCPNCDPQEFEDDRLVRKVDALESERDALRAEIERLREALTEAPMRALGQTNGAFARWCLEQAQPSAPAEVRHG